MCEVARGAGVDRDRTYEETQLVAEHEERSGLDYSAVLTPG
jgi:hypothetical protein